MTGAGRSRVSFWVQNADTSKNFFWTGFTGLRGLGGLKTAGSRRDAEGCYGRGIVTEKTWTYIIKWCRLQISYSYQWQKVLGILDCLEEGVVNGEKPDSAFVVTRKWL